MRTHAAVPAVLAVVVLAASWPLPARGGAIVGNGTPDSCNELALDRALGCNPSGRCSGNGNVTFNCGSGPVTVTVTSLETIVGEAGIDGGGIVTLDGGGKTPLFHVVDGGTLSLANVTIRGGVGGYGGSVSNSNGTLTVTNCTFSGNSAVLGGAIANIEGELSVTNSTFTDNSSNGDNGADGGAIYSAGNLDVTVTNSTFSGNSSNGGNGGGINSTGPLTVTNSTFSGNSASSTAGLGGDGGAIANNDPVAAVTLTNCTFSGNSAVHGGAISWSGNPLGSFGHPVTVTNTIFSTSTGGNCYVDNNSCILVGGCANAITDGGHNLEDSESCDFSTANRSLSNTNPGLNSAGLANNGGPTQTIALQAGSPAINAGDESVCSAPPVNNLDQRGSRRPGVGATNCSIGAYEYNVQRSSCVGDCDGSGDVTVNEIITLVNVALGTKHAADCPNGLPTGATDSDVTVALIIQAVNHALNGCAAG